MTAASNLMATMRTAVPFSAWQTAGFIRRIPSYWRIDRSNALRIRRSEHGMPLYVTPKISVFPPESLTTYLNWRYHGVEINESSAEANDFLELAEGCTALIDIGAQTGFMSALFARSRPEPSHIMSVEPDPRALMMLERAVALNRLHGTDWRIARTALSDQPGTLRMPVSNHFYEDAAAGDRAPEIDVPVTTLSSLVTGLEWKPDIIKIDVESFEHEILSSSLPLIESLKPAIQLEVHWEMLAARGRDARDFLAPLADLGYRGIRRRYSDLNKWLRAGRSDQVSRFALCAA